MMSMSKISSSLSSAVTSSSAPTRRLLKISSVGISGFSRGCGSASILPDSTTTRSNSTVPLGSVRCNKNVFMLQRDPLTFPRLQSGLINNGRNVRHFSSSSSIYNEDPNHLIIVGSGVAGSSAALVAAEKHNIPVTMLCAGATPNDCNSYWAQGGIIYRNYDPESNDSAESLMSDIHKAGAGLCDSEAVHKLATEGPDRVRELLLDDGQKGRDGVFANVPFDRTANGELSCCLEASHSAPRIIHHADQSGKAITEHITAAAMNHPLINIVTDCVVTDLIVSDNISGSNSSICIGAKIFNTKTGEEGSIYTTRGVTLASGGFGGIYKYSTNPVGFNALGSSVALGVRANATCKDLEYVQFHPTALNTGEKPFLLTEALRGEGAKLRDADGYAFAHEFHESGELAPRDIVARGVFAELSKNEGNGKVFLDITHRDADWLRNRFPTIQHYLQTRVGLDIAKDRLPITPAAHYTCGGVLSDAQGRTNVGNLYVAGEAARTGLHGGNRLASTSLLEGLVWGASVADFVGDSRILNTDVNNSVADDNVNTLPYTASELKEWASEELEYYRPQQQYPSRRSFASRNQQLNAKAAAKHLLEEVRCTMWNDVGVVRSPNGLARACDKLQELSMEAEELYTTNPCLETIMVRDASCSGLKVARSAAANRVSQGAHCIVDDEEETDEYEETAAAMV
eukprot:CAMPEP_0195530136 /NCGR_PEP_ID=MMETSP0794_2-20130614/32924_1 /TAXON_ID=515487 /ORGANISM="Stephanopyxis turris, Strain CCMP 815" /LENGTH=684 /DNA_ID=CAMNT_0040661571 /DNA_START=148 /DNA_END=2202 /DNA_ORIENTATION=-